jgi:hypothetical protein
MRRSYLAAAAAAGLLLALGASVEAAGRVGGGGVPFTPPGFSPTNPGFTNGNKGTAFDPYPSSNPSNPLRPSGWSQGTQGNANAPNPWKDITSPPGLQ